MMLQKIVPMGWGWTERFDAGFAGFDPEFAGFDAGFAGFDAGFAGFARYGLELLELKLLLLLSFT
jgi:hypothetical protein